MSEPTYPDFRQMLDDFDLAAAPMDMIEREPVKLPLGISRDSLELGICIDDARAMRKQTETALAAARTAAGLLPPEDWSI